MIIVPYVPRELLNIILEFDGRIKYRNGEYINILHKYDLRYDKIKKIINKKLHILKTIESSGGSSFYFEFGFDNCNVGLAYDCNFSIENNFEICYYDFRNDGIKQIRTNL